MAAQEQLKSRYEIKQTLGQGGIGVIYRAYDTVIRRDVGLKTIRDIPDPAALETFQKECGVLASMAHPNMIEISDLGEFENGANKPYFVMPLLPGLKSPDADSSVGKFEMFVPGDDQVGLSHLTFKPI